MKKLPIVAGFVVGIALAATVWSYLGFRDMIREAQLVTCLLTVEAHLKDAVISAQTDGSVALSNDWRTLSEREELVVLSKLSRGAFIECVGFPNIKEGKNTDSEPYLILVRKNGNDVDAKIANLRPGSFHELKKWTE